MLFFCLFHNFTCVASAFFARVCVRACGDVCAYVSKDEDYRVQALLAERSRHGVSFHLTLLARC